MSNINEKSLILKKETKFDIIRNKILRIFFKEEYNLEERLKGLMKISKVEISKIIIPKEIHI